MYAQSLGVPSIVLYTLAAVYGLGNHTDIAEQSPRLPKAILFEWIAANTISFSVGFAKISTMVYILDVQRRTYKWGKYVLMFAVGVNVGYEGGCAARLPPADLCTSSSAISSQLLSSSLNVTHLRSCGIRRFQVTAMAKTDRTTGPCSQEVST